MKVNFMMQSFLIYSADLTTFLSYDKGEEKNCKALSNKGWGDSIISVTRIIRAIDTTPHMPMFLIKYEVEL